MAQVYKSTTNDEGNIEPIPEVGSVLDQRKQRQEEGDLPQPDDSELLGDDDARAEGEDSDANKPKNKKFFSRIKEKMIKLKATLKEEIVGAPEAASFRDYVKEPAKEEDTNVPENGADAAGASGANPGELVPGDATPVAGVQSGKPIAEEHKGKKEVLGKDFDFVPVNQAAVTGENEKTIADNAKNEYFAKYPETAPGGAPVAEPTTPDQSEAARSKLSPEELRRMDAGLLAMYQKAGIPMPGKDAEERGNEAETGREAGMAKTDADIGKASAYRPTDVLPGQPGKVPQEVTTDNSTKKEGVPAATGKEEAATEGGTAPRLKDEAELAAMRRGQVPKSDVSTGVAGQPTEQDGGVGNLPQATDNNVPSEQTKGGDGEEENVPESEGKKDHNGGILEVIAEKLGLVRHDPPTTNADTPQAQK